MTTGYTALIVYITGCALEEAQSVEDLMRTERPTLDKLDREQFADLAKIAYMAHRILKNGWVTPEPPNPSANPTTGELVMNPGTVLPNGCVVVAASARNRDEWILLALKPGFHASGSYITWKCKRPGDGTDTVHGHYFDDIEAAAHDWGNRP